MHTSLSMRFFLLALRSSSRVSSSSILVLNLPLQTFSKQSKYLEVNRGNELRGCRKLTTWSHSRKSSCSLWSGSNLNEPPSASLEYGFCFVSRSITLNRSICCSMFFLASSSGFLSFISFELCQVFICSRKRCSFLISFFNSDSYFSFWLAFVAVCIWIRDTITSYQHEKANFI